MQVSLAVIAEDMKNAPLIKLTLLAVSVDATQKTGDR
jgi:hypothetical protein